MSAPRAGRIGLLVMLGGLFASACGATDEPVAEAAPGVRVVSVDDAGALLAAGGRTIIDVRTPAEFADGHLPDAILIDITDPSFADRLGELDPTGSYLVYCRTANRSAGARRLMDELGFRDVADVAGGVIAWTEAGFPLVTPRGG